MPVNAFQKEVLRLLAAHRSPESFVAGATVLNQSANSPRYSKDIDINHDIEEAVAASAERDGRVLEQHGFSVQWMIAQGSFRRALIRRGAEQVKLEWVFDSAFRFFPIEPDPECGWRLNFFDAATNKVLALAGRVKARDFVDVIHIHRTRLSFAALCWAASAKDIGMNPLFIVEEARRTAHYTRDDFAGIELIEPPNLEALYQSWRAALAEAEALIPMLPAEEVGCLYLDEGGTPVTPDPASPGFAKLKRHFGSVRGAWPVIRE